MNPRVRVFAAALLFGLGCTRLPAHPPASPRPELALDGVSLRVYRNSDPQLFARAAHLELMRSTGELTARDLHFDFLTDGVGLDSPHLSGNLGSQSFELTGGVRLVASDGALAGRTEAAHFEGREGERGVASGSLPVEFHGQASGRSYALTGQSFRFDVAQQHASFDAVQTTVGAPP